MFREGYKIGQYTLLKKLGRGGFGVVWLAEKQTALATRKVAIKMPNDDDVDLDAVRREAALWIEVSDHPNVLSFIDADIYDDQIIIVSEYAPDGSLATYLKKNGGKMPSAAESVEMAIGILSGLSHLHSKKIIHRDLKPANILLQGRTPRLVDFGLARVMKTTSHSKTVSGTYLYMPPETFAGSRSEQTDVYSVGVILFEMLTGGLPYPQDNDAALIGAILHGEPEPLPENLSKPLRVVVERAMEKDLNKRFKSALEMRAALQDAALTIHSHESSAAETEVLLPLVTKSEDNKITKPMVVSNVEESLYKTKKMEQPQTEFSPFVELKSEDKSRHERPTEKLPSDYYESQPSQESVTIVRTPTVEQISTALTIDVSNKSGQNITQSNVAARIKSRKNLYLGLGAGALILILIFGFTLVYFVSKSLSSFNRVSLSKEDVRLLISDFPPETLKQLAESKEKRKEILVQLKELLVFAAEARAMGIADTPEMKSQLAFQKSVALMQAYMAKAKKDGIKEDDAIKKEEIDAYLKKSGVEERFKAYLKEAQDSGQISAGEMQEAQMTQLKEQWAKVYLGEEKAIQAGLDKDRKTELQIAIQQALVLARKYSEEKMEKDKFKAEDAEIDKWIADHPEFDPKSKRTKAEELLKRARSGEDFAKLANENTDDPGNKDPQTGELKGGFYEFGRGVMDKNFETASFALQPGQISELVETPYGYHIIKLESKEKKKDKEGKEEEQVKVRHILISTMVKDKDNPGGRDLPLKEKAKQEIEKEKREKFVDDLALKHSITLPDDFDVVVPK